MNIIGNISNSLRYPTKNWVKLIILGIILIIPIVNLIGLGYYLRIIKSTIVGINGLPDFDHLGELFIDGIKVLIVGIIYAIVPLIFYTLSLVFAAPSSIPSNIPSLTEIPVIFLMLGTISALIISIFAYIGMANMAYYRSEISAAFRYHEILDRISAIGWGSYILWWIFVTLIMAVLGFIIGILGGIVLFFLIGLVVLLLGFSYYLMFQARSVARIFISSGDY